LRLICYPVSDTAPKLVPANAERDWMSATPDGFAYRCLPLNIANAHGWMILNPASIAAQWDGGDGKESVKIQATGGGATRVSASSHFGSGVLTFAIPALFRTETGYDLMVTGPVNAPKDGIAALTAIVETDWTPSTFTMNWKFTRPNCIVRFERDEPICMIFPIPRGLVEQTEPEIRSLETAPEVKQAYEQWAESRLQFNRELMIPGSAAQRQKWQKDYFQGAAGFGNVPADHRTKIRPKEFNPPSQ
jgi:hypothetical protein